MLLDEIPTEVLVHVLSGLHGADLASVSQVCHYLNAIVEPILYKVVSLTYHLPVPSPIRIFLRTILARPELARLVHVLILQWDQDLDHDPDLDGPDITLFASVAESVDLEYMVEFPGVQAILILHLLPNLRRLEAMVPEEDMDEFICGNTAPGMKSLRELDLHWLDSANGLTAPAFFATFGLPSLRKLSVHNVGDIDEIESFFDPYHHRRSPITHLSFGSDHVNTRSLQRVLELPRALTHFSFHCGRGSEDGAFRGLEFGEAICALRDTLVHLRVEICNGDIYSAISSLRGMAVLRSVWCPLSVLLHEKGADETLRDVLPVGIVRFTTELDRHWTAQAVRGEIRRLVDGKERYGLGHLEEVTLMGEGVPERISCVN